VSAGSFLAEPPTLWKCRSKANPTDQPTTHRSRLAYTRRYEQGRSAAREGLPVSAAAGMAVHESQSLLWERMVALSLPFCRFLLPKLRAAFPAFGEGKSAEDLYAAVNAIRAESFIRVEADEVT
jgi:Zn-dependent M32 family carboxypeptidase